MALIDTDRLPLGTRLVLMAEDLLEQIGTRTEQGDRITAEWGEQRAEGWYEPTFTAHADDNLTSVDRLARARHRWQHPTFPFGEGRCGCIGWAETVRDMLDLLDAKAA